MADEASLITWNPANWITVVLMVALAYFLLGAGVRVMREKSGAGSGA